MTPLLITLALGVMLAWSYNGRKGPYDPYLRFRLHQEVEMERHRRDAWPFW